MNGRPRAGTVHRAVWDAMHARWCGEDWAQQCGPSCSEWHPDAWEIDAAVRAVRAFDSGAPS